MKRIILSAAILLFGVGVVSAQSDWYMGGNIGFGHSKTELGAGSDKLTTVSVMPSIHKMMGQNKSWSLGLGLGYNYSKEDADGIKDELTLFSFAPQATWFVKLSDKFYFTPQVYLNAAFGEAKNREGGVTFKDDVTAFGGGINPLSFEFRPTSKLGINLSAGDFSYTHVKFDDSDTKSDNFNFKLNDNINFTLRFYF